MSQYGDGEYAEVSESAWRTARRDHECCACQEIIRAGQRYLRVFIIFDRSPYVYKRCERCDLIFDHLSARIRKEGDGEEYCDEALNCGHEYEERWNEPPPEWLAALAFWRPGDPLPKIGGAS